MSSTLFTLFGNGLKAILKINIALNIILLFDICLVFFRNGYELYGRQIHSE